MNNKYFNLYEQLPDPVIVTTFYIASLDLVQITFRCSALLITSNSIFFKVTHIVSKLLHTISCCQVNLSGLAKGKIKQRTLQAPLICTNRNLCLQLMWYLYSFQCNNNVNLANFA